MYCTLVVVFGFLLVRVRIIFAGDDVTDEDAITALKGMAMTFRIVSSHVCIDTITWLNVLLDNWHCFCFNVETFY